MATKRQGSPRTITVVGVGLALLLIGGGVWVLLGMPGLPGACPRMAMTAYADAVEPQITAYLRQAEMAQSVPRMNLTEPIQRLLDIETATRAIKAPACLVDYHQRVVGRMEIVQKGFQDFAADRYSADVSTEMAAVVQEGLAQIRDKELALIRSGTVPPKPSLMASLLHTQGYEVPKTGFEMREACTEAFDQELIFQRAVNQINEEAQFNPVWEGTPTPFTSKLDASDTALSGLNLEGKVEVIRPTSPEAEYYHLTCRAYDDDYSYSIYTHWFSLPE